jgi:hypothetical protein
MAPSAAQKAKRIARTIITAFYSLRSADSQSGRRLWARPSVAVAKLLLECRVEYGKRALTPNGREVRRREIPLTVRKDD